MQLEENIMEPISDEIKRRFGTHAVTAEQEKAMAALREEFMFSAARLERMLPKGRELANAVNALDRSMQEAIAALTRPASSHGRALTMESPK